LPTVFRWDLGSNSRQKGRTGSSRSGLLAFVIRELKFGPRFAFLGFS
jgi:hypothetical protein